jgi:hypothetical protein
MQAQSERARGGMVKVSLISFTTRLVGKYVCRKNMKLLSSLRSLSLSLFFWHPISFSSTTTLFLTLLVVLLLLLKTNRIFQKLQTIKEFQMQISL